jgi:hypothetical protein
MSETNSVPAAAREPGSAAAANACVGQKLAAENERVRVWMMHIGPGERVAPHRHVLDYMWIAYARYDAIVPDQWGGCVLR